MSCGFFYTFQLKLNHHMNRFLLSTLTSFLFLALSCTSSTKEAGAAANTKDTIPTIKKAVASSMAGNFSTQSELRFDSAAIKDFLKKYPDFNKFSKDLNKFYQSRSFSYAWYDGNGLIEQAASLYNRVEQLQEEGITRQLPYSKTFDALMDDNDSLLLREPMNAEAELMLTSQYFAYANIAWEGIDEKETQKLDWFLPRKKLSLKNLMDSLISEEGKTILEKEPVYYQYALLREYLKKYKTLEKNGGYPKITADKKSYKLGDSSNTIKTIRKSLYLMNDLTTPDTLSHVMDATLESAVKKFQLRHGWKDDGIIGAAMIREMNIPVHERILQLLVNMERCRWVPVDSKKDYIMINIPAYKLYVVENDSVAWNMNVVVGKSMHKTAIFNGDLKHVVFSPYWNVPPSILKNEIIPGIKRNPNYLKNHNMEWNGNGVRQKPGNNNSLGQVKFLFPNSFNIYLHDTPAKSLFSEDQRAFSHGCIRLSEPRKLATYLLRNDKNWNDASITEAMNAGKEKYVTLAKTVPVFIAYLTAWVDRAGELQFRNDIYNRDNRLAEMILTKE